MRKYSGNATIGRVRLKHNSLVDPVPPHVCSCQTLLVVPPHNFICNLICYGAWTVDLLKNIHKSRNRGCENAEQLCTACTSQPEHLCMVHTKYIEQRGASATQIPQNMEMMQAHTQNTSKQLPRN